MPGYCCPEVIEGRSYVDGGLPSMPNLGPLAGRQRDHAIVLSPLSTRSRLRGWDPFNRITDATRQAVARQLDAEIALLEAEGMRITVLEPRDQIGRAHV